MFIHNHFRMCTSCNILQCVCICGYLASFCTHMNLGPVRGLRTRFKKNLQIGKNTKGEDWLSDAVVK